MEVPCPVPLTEPWSPVGYRVVQVGDDKVPSRQQPPLVSLAASSAQPTPKLTTPRSPVGYKVVMVAEDIVPVSHPEPRRRELPKIWLPERRPPRSGSFAPLLILGVVGFLIFVPAFAVAMMSWTRRAHVAPPVAVVMPEAVAVVPDEIRDKAVEIKPAAAQPKVVEPNDVEAVAARPEPAADVAPVQARPLPPVNLPGAVDAACQDCVEAKIPGAPGLPGREAFATAVEFVRSPQEAARVAKKEDKLTFLLHLSGNFEDPGFT